ncbi:MAG: hypothetical protein LAT65_17260 [Saccharospirillum sp.]|nr:hypothetical protein [Saccharospirillum sp.]
MKTLTISLKASALGFIAALSIGCLASEPETDDIERFEFEGQLWPAPPFTPEQVQRFAHPEDYAVLQGLSMYQPQARGVEGFNNRLASSSFFLEERIRQVDAHIVSVSDHSYRILVRDRLGDQPMTAEDHLFSYSSLVWDQNGRIVGTKAEQVTNDDLLSLQSLEKLKYLQLDRDSEDKGLDLSLLSQHQGLRSLDMAASFKSFDALCENNRLTLLTIGFSQPNDEHLDISCFPELRRLIYGRNSKTSMSLSNLPELQAAAITFGRLINFTLEGRSLPSLKSLVIAELEVTNNADIEWPENLEYLNISNANLPGGFPPLPESLRNLNMKEVSAPRFSRIQLPENLNYLDLEGAQLDDYSLILGAKNLESLVLMNSNFEQWALLPELENLKHLDLINTPIEDEHLEYLAKMEQLQSLFLGSTNVSTLLPLASLQNLNYLSFSLTNVENADEVPFIKDISHLGYDMAFLEKHEGNWPDHFQRMFENLSGNRNCNGLKPCEVPIFSRISRGSEVRYHSMD